MSLTNNDTLLQVNNLKKYFPTPHGLLYAVDNVSFNINKGDTLGVVGESGCGKSTLGRSILRLHEPTAGEVIFEGKNILSLNHAQMKHMRKDMQLIFQDPYESLNPRMTVSQAIQAPMLIQGMYKSKDKAALEKRTLEMMDIISMFLYVWLTKLSKHCRKYGSTLYIGTIILTLGVSSISISPSAQSIPLHLSSQSHDQTVLQSCFHSKNTRDTRLSSAQSKSAYSCRLFSSASMEAILPEI